MNYKELLNRIIQLISSPAKAWEEIALEGDRRQVLSTFVYPMIGLCGLMAFVGSLIKEGMNYQHAMTICCIVFVSLFGGYFLSAFLINTVGKKYFGLSDNLPLIQQFVGYAMVVVFLINLTVGIIPSLENVFLIVEFYTVYIIWEATKAYLEVEEEKRVNYSLIVSVILIFCPFVIKIIFKNLIDPVI